jgi:hypothetical protein
MPEGYARRYWRGKRRPAQGEWVFTALIVVTAVSNLAAAVADFRRAGWILRNMDDYGVPRSWLPWLGAAKLLGAAGLVIPPLTLAAATGLVLYFLGAVGVVLRARRYPHLVFPGFFLALAAATLTAALAGATPTAALAGATPTAALAAATLTAGS